LYGNGKFNNLLNFI